MEEVILCEDHDRDENVCYVYTISFIYNFIIRKIIQNEYDHNNHGSLTTALQSQFFNHCFPITAI